MPFATTKITETLRVCGNDLLAHVASLLEEEGEIKSNGYGFDMISVAADGPCNSIACIFGHGLILKYGAAYCSARRQARSLTASRDVYRETAELFGLSFNQATSLCWHWSGDPDDAQAARTIRHLMATGEVDWTI